MPDECSLCRPDLAPKLMTSALWALILNHNQNLLGKCFLALNRHLEAVTALTTGDWLDLQVQLRRATEMLISAFQPDHFNYAFLQNQDRHVHLHIIPRYAAPRDFGGSTFYDPDYPSHYSVPSPDLRLSADQLAALAAHLQKRLQ